MALFGTINENSKQYAKFIEELTIPYYFVNHSTNELPSLARLYEEASYVLTRELLQNNHKKLVISSLTKNIKKQLLQAIKSLI